MPIYKKQLPIDLAIQDVEVLVEKYGLNLFEEAFQFALGETPQQKNKKENIDVLLSDAIQFYLTCDNYKDLADSSQLTYKYEAGLFLRYCESHHGRNCLLQHAYKKEFLLTYLSQTKSSYTKSKKASFLRSLFSATFEHYFDQEINSMKRFLKVKVDKSHHPKAFQYEQIEELCGLARRSQDGFRNFTILWTFLGTGIRLAELCDLQIGDIEPETQSIYVFPKGSKEDKQKRKIAKFSLELLVSYTNFKYGDLKGTSNYKDLYIFSVDNGAEALSRSTVQKMVEKLIKDAKTITKGEDDRYLVHSLRHSFAIFCLQSEVDIYTISRLLGHERLSSTEKYLDLFDSMLIKAIDKHPFANMTVKELFS